MSKLTLQHRAQTLVSAANTNATDMYEVWLKNFPSLKTVKPSRWNFIVTIASIFIAMNRLTKLELEDDKELAVTVSKKLIEWEDKNSSQAFENCKAFFEQTYEILTKSNHDPKFIINDSIGSWIVWNIQDRAPETTQEWEMVRSIGTAITHAFFDWWSDSKP